MRSTCLPAPKSRRSLLTAGFALALALAPAGAWAQNPPSPQQPPAQQTPPAQQPQNPQTPAAQNPPAQPAQPAQQAAAPGRMFTGPAGVIFNPIKPDHTADFEMVMGRVKEALAKSPDPKRKAQAAGWKVFKAAEPFNGNVLYLFVIDPTVQDEDYTISKILAEAFPSEVQDLWKKFVDCYAGGQNMINLQLIANMATTAPAGGGQ
ncbi:MAG TPA: hypothetical protein VFX12_00915 [Vicinamibacterales bacterium]|nr:hypothetical protein [Vicinamibacterales bacterium]